MALVCLGFFAGNVCIQRLLGPVYSTGFAISSTGEVSRNNAITATAGRYRPIFSSQVACKDTV